MNKGIVIESLVKEYILIDLETKQKIYAQVKGKMQQFRLSVDKSSHNFDYSQIKIGDIVFYEPKNDKFLIEKIEPRSNELKRPNIANINQVFLIFSLVNPQFQFKLLDKFLLILQKNKLKVVLIFTKLDLISPEKFQLFQKKISYYRKFYTIHYVDSKNKKGLDKLYLLFYGKITILAGQTGVGKSTLLNTLTSLKLKTQEISVALKRGKHTTKNSKLFFFYGGYIADTPGFSRLDLSHIQAIEIKNFYPDFALFKDECFFGHSCLHINENKCKVKEAYQKKLISPIRYHNYLSFFREIENKNKKNGPNKKFSL